MNYVGEYDVVVVGAGPVGATVAREAAKGGARVLLLEKRKSPIYPERCAGIISPRCLREANVDGGVVVRRIRGGYIHAPDGRSLRIEASEPRAVVIDRHLFNERLLRAAREAGAEYMPLTRACFLEDRTLFLEREGRPLKVRAGIIVGADGSGSEVARWVGFPPPSRYLLGIQAIVPYDPERGDFVEIFLDQDIAPGFFAWVVPAEEGVARVGLATHEAKGIRYRLKKLLEKLNLQPIKVRSGFIPIGARARTVKGRVALVGDAAAQAKPTTGGGLYPGIVAAKILGEVLCGDHPLSLYERRWRSRLSHELRLGMMIRRIAERLGDREISYILAFLGRKKFLRMIGRLGDIDHPSVLLKALSRDWWEMWKSLKLRRRPAL